MSECSDYQHLRAHLSFLLMSLAAEALPGQLTTPGGRASPTRVPGAAPGRGDAPSTSAAVSLARFASLRSPFTLADFDFSAQPSVDRYLVAELGTLRFVEDPTNILLIGPPGVERRAD